MGTQHDLIIKYTEVVKNKDPRKHAVAGVTFCISYSLFYYYLGRCYSTDHWPLRKNTLKNGFFLIAIETLNSSR